MSMVMMGVGKLFENVMHPMGRGVDQEKYERHGIESRSKLFSIGAAMIDCIHQIANLSDTIPITDR